MNLFAACGQIGSLVVKRVRLDATVQQAVEGMFNTQEIAFRDGVIDEVPFDGRWIPDEDEFLTIQSPPEAAIFSNAILANATSVPDINTAAFANEGIKALFMGISSNNEAKVLVQRFTSLQMLERKFALFQQGNAFRRLTDPAFCLDSALACIIEGGRIKFKSQQKLRSIINMVDIYRAATDQEVQAFADHISLNISNISSFLTIANQPIRKLIHAVANNGTLDTYTPAAIQAAAALTGLTVTIQNNQIAVPVGAAEVKALLQFLNESRYSGPLSGKVLISNSQRPA